MSEVESNGIKPKRRRSRKYAAIPTVAVPDESELGPAMLALSPKRRLFVLELANGPAGYGSEIRACRAAGYSGNDDTVKANAYRLVHHDGVQAALREVGAKMIRASAFAAIRQTERIANDVEHRDCLKACLALLDRGGFAVESHHTVTVEHKSLDDQAIEALRTMRALKASREQLVEMFGANGLARYENMLADKATTVIEAQP
jgi:phage terminase small subunit